MKKSKKPELSVSCPHCGGDVEISDDTVKSVAATMVRGHTPTTPKKMTRCKYCREHFGAREMRKHIPRCPKNPNKRQRNS